MRLCRSMYEWLASSPVHVVVVHCLAGKGRTGLVVAALLIYAGLFTSAQAGAQLCVRPLHELLIVLLFP